MQQEELHARAAIEKLTKNAADSDANLARGRYHCLVKGDWTDGLANLAKGANPALHAAATADLAKPTTTEKQVAAGDLWWDASEREQAGAQKALRRRAGYWYSQAIGNPQFTGLSRARVEKRLSQAPPPLAAGPVASTTEAAPAAVPPVVAPGPGGGPAVAAPAATVATTGKKNVLLLIGDRREEVLFKSLPDANLRVVEQADTADVLAKPDAIAGASLIVFGQDRLSKAPESAFTDEVKENLRAFVENGGSLVVLGQSDHTNWMVIQKPFAVHQHANAPFHGAAIRAYELDAKIRAAGLTDQALKKLQFATAFDVPAIKGMKMYFASLDGGGAIVVARIPYGTGQVLLIGTSADPANEPLDRFLINHFFRNAPGVHRSAGPVSDPIYLSEWPDAKIYPGQPPLSRGKAIVRQVEVGHAVGISTRATLNSGAIYDVGGKYNRLRAAAAFSDAIKSKVNVKFVVRGDGKILWQSEMLSGTQQLPKPCLVDITGIQKLEIGADPTNDLRDVEAIWIDPQVFTEGGAAVSPPPTASPANSSPDKIASPASHFTHGAVPDRTIPASAKKPGTGDSIFNDADSPAKK